MKDEVKTEPDRFSLLYVPNQFIIPGGRFREFYYWDAYWIVKVSFFVLSNGSLKKIDTLQNLF